MKSFLSKVLLVALMLTPMRSLHADDVSGKWGIGGLGLVGFPLGQESVKDQARDAGAVLGGFIRYGLKPNWSLGASYENYDAGHRLRAEPILLNLIHHCRPNQKWGPSLLLGAGASRGMDVKNFNHIAGKVGLALDYFVSSSFSLGPQVNYYHVSDKDDSVRHLNALGAGLGATYFFGATKSVVAVPAPVAAPAPAGSVELSPDTADLQATQTHQVNAKVTGLPNKELLWTLTPNLGTISPTGLYTAPANIALREKVIIKAMSQVDNSKWGQACVNLIPAVSSSQQVQIDLRVLFDTGKAVVKPEFNAEIQKVAEFMKTYTSAKAEIEGHTDNVGSAAMNTALSQRRADAVKKVLVDNFGIETTRLSAKGYGPDKPMADNATAEGRQKNRRVVATLSSQN